jgi:hypothetical protein
MKSESGSVSKFRIGSHNAQAKDVDTPPRRNDRVDPRMDYFHDYGTPEPTVKGPGTSKHIRPQCGST